MSENMTIDMEKDQDNGQITYANEVISTIVSVATTEVEGISGIVGATSMTGIIGKGRTPRGVRVDMDGQDVNVDVIRDQQQDTESLKLMIYQPGGYFFWRLKKP